jgi:hypothetical protein
MEPFAFAKSRNMIDIPASLHAAVRPIRAGQMQPALSHEDSGMKTNPSKRSFLKSVSAVAGAAAGVPFFGTAFAAPLVSDAEKWTHVMAALGPRITCGEAHRKWITYGRYRIGHEFAGHPLSGTRSLLGSNRLVA